jgi:hypothetical protein
MPTSSEVSLGSAHGRMIDPSRLRRLFRLRQLARVVRPPGHIRLHHFGLDVDPGRWGQAVEVLLDDDAVRIEPADHRLVSYPCVDDPRQRRMTAVDGTGRQSDRQVQVMPWMCWALERVRTVWRLPRYRRASWLTRARPVSHMHLFD